MKFETLEIRRLLTRLVDLDDDGDLDLFDRYSGWYENDQSGGAYVKHDLPLTLRDLPSDQQVRLVDLDQDGDLDIVSPKLEWLENRGGDFSTVHEFSSQGTRLDQWQVRTHLLDLQNDGDVDILFVSHFDQRRVHLYENVDSSFHHQGEHGLSFVGTVGDLDQDGVPEEIGVSRSLIRLVPAGPAGFDLEITWTFWRKEFGTNMEVTVFELSEQTFEVDPIVMEKTIENVKLVDVDNDGDQDVVARWRNTASSGQHFWYENIDGVFAGGEFVVDLDDYTNSEWTDVDLDGDIDLFWLNWNPHGPNSSGWIENVGNETGFVDCGCSVIGSATDLTDINMDGTADFIIGLEWIDGKTNERFLLHSDRDANLIRIDILQNRLHDPTGHIDSFSDYDGNGRTDDSDLDHLIEKMIGTVYGDSNLDGVFNSADLVQIFTAGEYEDGVFENSTWASGDWDSDGDFTTSDLTFVFQKATYSLEAIASRLDRDLNDRVRGRTHR